MIKKVKLNDTLLIHTKKDFSQACKAAFDFLKIPDQVKGKDKIIIKPNIASCRPYEAGSVTDPLVLDLLLEQLRKSYHGEIIIAEAEAVFKSQSYIKKRKMAKTKKEWKEGFLLSMKTSGVQSILEKRQDPKISVLDISDTEYADPNQIREIVRRRYEGLANKIHSDYLKMVPKSFLQGNILGINLAKFKSHNNRPTIVTLGIKNFFGLTPPPNREHLHGAWHNSWRLVESITSMLLIYTAVIQSWLYVVEGLRYCMQGNAPIHGMTIQNWGKIAASTNPVELDAICASIMGQDPSALPYLKKASQYMGDYDKTLISKIPPQFFRQFKLHEHVMAWIEKEHSHHPRILYLKLAGFIWNKMPGLARLLSFLLKAVKHLFTKFRSQRSL